MSQTKRYEAEWLIPGSRLHLFEPSAAEIAAAADPLALAYNEPHNRAMMAHSGDMTPAEVAAHFAEMQAQGDRPFLLYLDGGLMGDADLRHIEHDRAECAILIGNRATQGKGLGTRFALMVHALAFRALGLSRVYVSIIPPNRGSQRLFEKLGYLSDNSPEARSYADEDDDLTLSVDRARVEKLHGAALAEIRVCERPWPGKQP